MEQAKETSVAGRDSRTRKWKGEGGWGGRDARLHAAPQSKNMGQLHPKGASCK